MLHAFPPCFSSCDRQVRAHRNVPRDRDSFCKPLYKLIFIGVNEIKECFGCNHGYYDCEAALSYSDTKRNRGCRPRSRSLEQVRSRGAAVIMLGVEAKFGNPATGQQIEINIGAY